MNVRPSGTARSLTPNATPPLLDVAAVRTLPLRISALPGESLESWLEAIAARYGATLREIYEAMGFPHRSQASGCT